jgi:hypothetical protein
MQLNYAGRPFYQLGIAGFKASLCLSYLRLISGTSMNMYRILIWGVIVLCTVGHIAGALVLIFNCSPVRDLTSTLAHLRRSLLTLDLNRIGETRMELFGGWPLSSCWPYILRPCHLHDRLRCCDHFPSDSTTPAPKHQTRPKGRCRVSIPARLVHDDLFHPPAHPDPPSCLW